MTVIVAARTKSGVVMAADSQTTAGWQKQYKTGSKLWAADPFGFGAAGCVRTAQVVRHFTTWPKYRPKEIAYDAYLIKELVPAIRRGVEGHGVLKSNGGPDKIDATLLVCTKTEIAEVSGNGAVVAERCERMAIGSGFAEALGSLGENGPWTEDDVIQAVARARQTNLGVGGPISVLRMRDLKAWEVAE